MKTWIKAAIGTVATAAVAGAAYVMFGKKSTEEGSVEECTECAATEE